MQSTPAAERWVTEGTETSDCRCRAFSAMHFAFASLRSLSCRGVSGAAGRIVAWDEPLAATAGSRRFAGPRQRQGSAPRRWRLREAAACRLPAVSCRKNTASSTRASPTAEACAAIKANSG